jgi:hypothetical protein
MRNFPQISSREMKAPNTNIQHPEKLQAPITQSERRFDWSLKFGISLELGCWCLALSGMSARLKNNLQNFFNLTSA